MNNSRRNAFSDINRPLPKLPSEDNQALAQNTKNSLTNHTTSTSFVESLNNRLTEIPMWSTSISGKNQFEGLSRDFSVPPTPSLSFQEREALGCLDPVKFNPSDNTHNSSIFESSPMFKT